MIDLLSTVSEAALNCGPVIDAIFASWREGMDMLKDAAAVGFMPGGIASMLMGQEKPATIVHTASPTSPALSPASPYTETGVSIGTAATDRYIIVQVSVMYASNVPITGVTVAGVACTLLERCPGTVLGDLSYWITNTPITTGTTATISCTYATSGTYISMEIFAATGLKSTTPTDSASIGNGSATTAAVALGTLTVQQGGFFLGCVSGWQNVSCSYTWSGTLGATEATDNNPDGNDDVRQTAAILNSTSGATGTATGTCSVAFVGGRRAGVAICMR